MGSRQSDQTVKLRVTRFCGQDDDYKLFSIIKTNH